MRRLLLLTTAEEQDPDSLFPETTQNGHNIQSNSFQDTGPGKEEQRPQSVRQQTRPSLLPRGSFQATA